MPDSLKPLKYAEDASRIAAAMSIQAARTYAAGRDNWPSYTTECGQLRLILAYPAPSGDSWRWQLDGKPVNPGRAVRLIAERMAAKLDSHSYS